MRLETKDIRPATLKPLEFKNDDGLSFYSLTLKYTENMKMWAAFITFRERLSIYGIAYELIMTRGADEEFFLILSSTNPHVMAQAELIDWVDGEVVTDTPDAMKVIRGKKLDLSDPGMN